MAVTPPARQEALNEIRMPRPSFTLPDSILTSQHDIRDTRPPATTSQQHPLPTSQPEVHITQQEHGFASNARSHHVAHDTSSAPPHPSIHVPPLQQSRRDRTTATHARDLLAYHATFLRLIDLVNQNTREIREERRRNELRWSRSSSDIRELQRRTQTVRFPVALPTPPATPHAGNGTRGTSTGRNPDTTRHNPRNLPESQANAMPTTRPDVSTVPEPHEVLSPLQEGINRLEYGDWRATARRSFDWMRHTCTWLGETAGLDGAQQCHSDACALMNKMHDTLVHVPADVAAQRHAMRVCKALVGSFSRLLHEHLGVPDTPQRRRPEAFRESKSSLLREIGWGLPSSELNSSEAGNTISEEGEQLPSYSSRDTINTPVVDRDPHPVSRLPNLEQRVQSPRYSAPRLPPRIPVQPGTTTRPRRSVSGPRDPRRRPDDAQAREFGQYDMPPPQTVFHYPTNECRPAPVIPTQRYDANGDPSRSGSASPVDRRNVPLTRPNFIAPTQTYRDPPVIPNVEPIRF